MGMTLLEIVDQVSGELGLAQPASVIGNTANQTVQMLALANRLGKDLVAEFEWNYLVKTYVFQTDPSAIGIATLADGSTTITNFTYTTAGHAVAAGDVVSGDGIAPYTQVAGISSATVFVLDTPASETASSTLTFNKQFYTLPSDFDRQVSDTFWDRTNHWRNLGAKSSQAMSTLRGGVISVGPRERFRIYRNQIQYFPAPADSLNQSLDYVSNYWCNLGLAPAFVADTDQTIWPDNLFLAGLKYYFLKAKKLDYGPELGEYSDILATRKAQDQPLPTLSLSPLEYPMLVGPWSVQDGNWPTT